jgi:hypothetical protein
MMLRAFARRSPTVITTRLLIRPATFTTRAATRACSPFALRSLISRICIVVLLPRIDTASPPAAGGDLVIDPFSCRRFPQR